MSGKPQKHVHKINNCPIAASKAVPGSSLDADISALNEKLSTKKDLQDPVASPDADGSGIAFIDTVSQNANGEIAVTKKNVQQASTSSAGLVQLSSEIDSISETMAATPKAVHDAIIEAEQSTVAGLNAENTVPAGHYITSVDETEGFVSITTAAMDDGPTQDSTKPVKSGGVFASIGAEAIERAGADAAFQQLIPPAASEHNQLADKAYVDAIGERVEARYLSYSQDGLPFPTYDDFGAAQQTDTFYYMNALTAPNNNDVIVITADRTHLNENDQPTTTRWRFFKPEIGPGEWRYEYTINNSALSEAQLLAINSGINAVKVENYDAHVIDQNNPHHVTAAQVGLGNVDNTADLDKPISTATQTALDGKADNVVDGTANHIVVLGDNGKTLVDSHAAITSSYDGTDEINPVTGSAVAAAIGELDAGPFGGEWKYIVSVSETAGVVTATEGTLDAEPTENSTNPVKSGGVHQHLSTKADKDTDAVKDNVAVFDGNGNPVDGGISKNDLEAAISSAGSSVQGVSIDGTALTPGANNVVDIPLATTSADGAMSADDKAKLDGIASGAEANVQADWSETNSESDAFIKNKPNLATVATTGEYGDLLHIPADLVHDASYVHTDNNYTVAEKEKLSGIESGAEANVQSDWTESDGNSDAFIKNKPENLVQDAEYVHTDNNYTTAEKEKLAGIEDGAEVNVIETVKVDDIPLTVTDKTVNIDLSGKADKADPSAKGNLAGLDDTGNLADSGISGTLDSAPTENSGNLVTSGAVYDALDGKANKVSGATPGNFAEFDTNGNLTDSGKSYADLAGAFKAKQSPVNDPAASGTAVSFIDTIEQDSDGEITVTKKTVPSASSTQDGLMSSSDWSKLNALPDASTLANDLAAKADKDADAVEGNLAVFDGNGNPVDSGAKITSAYDGRNSTDPVTGAAVGLAIAGKANKVSDATEGNFAGLDANGNLTDSGSNASDFAIFGHSHGNISNDGKVGSTAGLSVVTTTGGEVTAVDLATADVAASGTTLTAVSAVTQDSRGKISVEKKTIQDGTTSQKGVVQLSSATDSDSETVAATSKAVKAVMDSVDGLSGKKADKVSNATAGNFAGLNSEGNLTDSGKKASDFKTKQAAVSDPTASGNTISFIDTISQDTNGVIAPTKKTVSLSSAVDSEAEDAAATPKAVKLAYEHADSVVSDLDAEVTSTDGTNVQVKVTQANGKIAGVNIATDNTESVNNKVSSFQTAPDDVHYPSEKLVKDSLDLKANKSEMTVTPGTGANADKTTIQLKTGTSATVLTAHQDITGKADKVSRATAGNFAGLDSNGNLVDSGKSYSDLEDTFKARQTAKVSPAASGNTLSFIDTVSQDENGEITATKKTVTVDSTYSSAGTNPVNGKAVAAAIGTLDVNDISGFGAGKTLATLTETDGKVAATFQDIEITKSQVSDFPTEMTPSSHTHGNITDDGKIGNTAGLGIVTGTGGTVTTKDFTKASPTTGPDTTTEFISTVAQGSDGAISATKKAITPASTSAAGIVQLSSSTSSSSETMAATPKAVSDLAASLGAAKADKVSGATEGNFAGLDSNGNLTDSGKKASDFATAAQGSKADTAIQGVKVNGTELTKDSLNKVDITAVTGVKGSSESTYRTGQVSITAGNVGAYTTTETDAALALKEDTANKKQTVNASSTTEFPSSAAVAAFVNSSIATVTANFLGNYMLTDLGLAYPATNAQIEGALETHTWPAGVTPTNNDYVIVSISSTTDPATGEPVIDEYRRFKYNDGESSWAYEYTLNNSSFTSAQWGAINSGITAGDKSAYDDHLADTSNPHSVTAAQVGLGNVDNTADIDKPISTATQAALDDKVDKVYTATENHIAVFDNAGNIKDSGKTYSDMQGEFKRKQTAKSSPTASGNALSFIDTVSQDAEGVITATKKSVTVDSTYSSSGTNPVNGKAIKAAIDGLDAAITSNDGTNVQVKVTETDGKISAVNITSDNTENRNNKASSWQTTPDNTHYPTEKLVKDSLDGKVDKAEGKGLSTEDYTTAEKTKLAGIAAGAEVNQNAFSNVKVGSTTIAADSKTDTLEIAGGTGIDADGDTANSKVTLSLNSATQLSLGKADSAVQSVKINGGGELKDASGNVNIPLAVATGSTGAKAGALSADDKKKLNDLGTAASRNVPASGNAGNAEVVLGSDTRLSAGASAVQDVTVDGTSVVNSSKVAVVPNASTSAKGAVQLAGSIGATVASENNKAATEKAVRDAINALDSNKTSTDGTNVQVKVTETDGKISAVNITADNTENKNNKVTAWSGTTTDAHYPSEKLVKSSLDGKASSTHTHGNITNDGKIGSTANLVVVTGTSGVVTTADLTTASPTVPTSGTTTSLEFIDTVGQDSKGKISATKKAVPVDSTYSSTGTNPVNGKAIAAAIGGLDSNKTSTDGVNVQVKVTETDGKISAVNVTTDNTENKNNKVSTWQTTPDNTHYPSEKLVKDGLDAKADSDKVVAIADARIDRNGTDGWFKIASKAFNSNGVDLKFQWIVSALGYADNSQNVTFFLNLTIGFGSSGSNPSIGRFETSPIKKDSIGCDFKAIVNGTVGNATIELWVKVGSRYGSVAIRELQAGNFRGADAKGFLTYASYSPSDAGSSEEPTGNVSKKLSFVYVQEVIASPTKDNLVAMDANGLVKDSGLAKSSVESAISKAGSAIQGVKVNGTTLTPDANKIVTVPLATKSADGAMSAADKTKLDGIAAGAEVNQNAFGNVKVGSTTVAADSKTDTLELASSSAITLTPDAANDKVTIGVSTMGAASSSAAGTAGIVPAPGAGKQASFLRGDGTWVVPTNTDTLVKATAKADNANYKILATASASPTSGNATEAVYDTDISLNPSTNTITSNISGNAATATKPAVTTLTASDNLNNVGGSTVGDVLWYKWASGSAPANVPIAGSAVMEVVRTHSNKYITQTVYTTDHSVYRRECINGTWGAWYAYSKSTHTHGNITSGGALQTTDVAIANGDKLVITDASDSNKVARSSTAFDGSTITKALTQKGTFESVVLADDAMPLSAADGVKITYSGSTATISGNFAAGAGVGITYANNVATFSADISAIPLATIYALS